MTPNRAPRSKAAKAAEAEAAAQAAAEHGTDEGWRQHVATGTKPCRACDAEHRAITKAARVTPAAAAGHLTIPEAYFVLLLARGHWTPEQAADKLSIPHAAARALAERAGWPDMRKLSTTVHLHERVTLDGYHRAGRPKTLQPSRKDA